MKQFDHIRYATIDRGIVVKSTVAGIATVITDISPGIVIVLSLLGSLFWLPTQAMSAPAPSTGQPTKVISLVGTLGTKNAYHGKVLELIYREAFRRLGYDLNYTGYPAKRASYLSDRGEADGEIHRVADYGSKHPNVIKVDEPHFSIRFSAYGLDPNIKLNGWQSLTETSYTIGYRRGVKKCETILPELIPKKRLIIANSIEQGFRQVQGGRSKIFIDVQQNLSELTYSEEFRNAGFRPLGVMEVISVHAFLHKKHSSLVPKLSSVLKAMKAEGLVESYRAKAEE